MESKESGRSQEEMIKELKLLIELVRAYYKAEGVKVTQEELAVKMKKGKKFLSHLINGHETINEGHIVLFKGFFKKELPSGSLDDADMKNITSAIYVIQRRLAELQERMPDGINAALYLKKLKREIELVSVQQ